MLTFDEARARVLDGAPVLEPERVALFDALGRILREPLVAKTPFPRFDYSAMDGYSVNSASFSGDGPWELPVKAESRAGRVTPTLEAGTACRIFTGAPIPGGADAVVMQENVVRHGDVASFSARPAPGDHIRRKGEDLAEGVTVLDAGARLEAYQLGLAAALDLGAICVGRRPRVVVVATGDELRAPGSEPRDATIPESNGLVIAALAARAGASVEIAERASDTLDDARARFGAVLDGCDVLVTIGGVSVGAHDVVRPALEALGVRLDFYKVAIKPGKPLTLGRRGNTVVLGLPGNPVSAQLTFALFGLPLLRHMQGGSSDAPPVHRRTLTAPQRQKAGRRGFYVATATDDRVTPLRGQASGSIASLALANALVVVPEDSIGHDAGETADVLMLDEL